MDVLIGSDNYWNLETGKVKRGCMGPVAMSTRLGWVLSGPFNQAKVIDRASVNYVIAHTLRTDTQTVTDLHTVVSKFWELKNFSKTWPLMARDMRKLPWKTSHSALPVNYDLCFRRLERTVKRLKSLPEILKEYKCHQGPDGKGNCRRNPKGKKPPAGKSIIFRIMLLYGMIKKLLTELQLMECSWTAACMLDSLFSQISWTSFCDFDIYRLIACI